MGARYLVDGYCLDEAVAFKLYVGVTSENGI